MSRYNDRTVNIKSSANTYEIDSHRVGSM